jgi:hypothetical protein
MIDHINYKKLYILNEGDNSIVLFLDIASLT